MMGFGPTWAVQSERSQRLKATALVGPNPTKAPQTLNGPSFELIPMAQSGCSPKQEAAAPPWNFGKLVMVSRVFQETGLTVGIPCVRGQRLAAKTPCNQYPRSTPRDLIRHRTATMVRAQSSSGHMREATIPCGQHPKLGVPSPSKQSFLRAPRNLNAKGQTQSVLTWDAPRQRPKKAARIAPCFAAKRMGLSEGGPILAARSQTCQPRKGTSRSPDTCSFAGMAWIPWMHNRKPGDWSLCRLIQR